MSLCSGLWGFNNRSWSVSMKRILLVANCVSHLVFKSLVQHLYLLRLLLLLLLLVQLLDLVVERNYGRRCSNALKIGDMGLMTSFATLVTLVNYFRSNPRRCVSLHTSIHQTISFPLLIDFDGKLF